MRGRCRCRSWKKSPKQKSKESLKHNPDRNGVMPKKIRKARWKPLTLWFKTRHPGEHKGCDRRHKQTEAQRLWYFADDHDQDRGISSLPVDAPDGTDAEATVPFSRQTITFNVGFPRESRISRAVMSAILAMRRNHCGISSDQRGSVARPSGRTIKTLHGACSLTRSVV